VSSFSARQSGRGASSRSGKSDDTLRTPLLDDDTSDSGSDDSVDSSTAASYEGVPREKPSPFQLAKLAVGESSARVIKHKIACIDINCSLHSYNCTLLLLINSKCRTGGRCSCICRCHVTWRVAAFSIHHGIYCRSHNNS